MGMKDIVAGAAFVKMTMDDAELRKGLESAKGRIKNFTSQLNTWSTKVAAYGSLLAFPIMSATKSFADFDDQMRLTAAITGGTVKELKLLRDLALQLGRETSFTATQVAGGMVALGRMGFSPDEIKMAIKHMMNLSRTTNTDLALASEIAGNALRALGLDVSKTALVCDLLMATANGSAQTLEDLGEALKYAAPAARTVGEDIYDVNKALGVLANVGIRGSLAGTALKRAYSELAKPEVQEYLKKFNVEVVDGNGNLRKFAEILRDCAGAMANMGTAEKLNFATQVFGERAAPAALSISVDMSKIDEFLRKLESASGASQKVAEEMESGAGGKIRIMMSALEGVVLAFGEIAAVSFGPAIENLSQLALSVRSVLGENSGLIGSFLKLTGSIVSVAAGIKVLSMLKNGLGTLFSPLLALDRLFAGLIAKKIAAATASRSLAAAELLLAKSNSVVGKTSLFAAMGQKVATAATLTFKGALDLLCTHPVIIALAVLAGSFYALFRAEKTASVEAVAAARAHERNADKIAEENKKYQERVRTENEYIQKLKGFAAAGKLSLSQQVEAKGIIEKLTSSYGDLGITLNSVTGEITGVTEAFEKLSAKQKATQRENLKTEISSLRKSADQQRRSFMLGPLGLVGIILNGDKRTLMKLLGFGKKKGEFKTYDKVGYADLAQMQKALEFAQDLDMHEEAAKLEKIVELLKREKKCYEDINALDSVTGESTAVRRKKIVKGLEDIEKIENDFEKKNTPEKSKFEKEIEEIEALKKKYIKLVEERKKYFKEKGMTDEYSMLSSKSESQILKFNKKLQDLRKESLDEEAKKKAAAEKKEKSRLAAEGKYKNFLAEFDVASDLEKSRKNDDKRFERYLKDESSRGAALLREFMMDLGEILDSKRKDYEKYLSAATSEASEYGKSFSDDEKKELDKLQDEIRKAADRLESYRGRIEAGRVQAENKMEMKTFAAFDPAALAGLFGLRPERDVNAEITARATARTEHHVRSLLWKVGKGITIK